MKSKHLLAIMTFSCVSGIIATFAAGAGTGTLQAAAGAVVIPFQKSISSIASCWRISRRAFAKSRKSWTKMRELKSNH